ncbi:FH1/FH2 domain-containing protein 1 [Liparis tanakae]|uniref:FH1/FH2 domain-containing protein 1 n=1 Tax=Liparis tanakae TaxID=230148 RepID=A0A4Z2DZX2_9TELE|nr:FH1/FH2 domain-containing protein 1 [Liparis tanakae]
MESHARRLETTPMTPMTPMGPGAPGGDAWNQLQPSAAALRIKDLDFSDLLDEEDVDVLDMDSFDCSSSSCGIPPPPPLPPPGMSKKTVKLFWRELKQTDEALGGRFGGGTVWASLDRVCVDTARLQHLFESRAKEMPVAKVTPGHRCIVGSRHR